MTPVLAASVVVLRDAPLEVLMLRRHDHASFVPGLWVFPGGAADEADFEGAADTLEAMRVTAARELFEESGVWLGATPSNADEHRRALLAGNTTLRAIGEPDVERLVWLSHWITPIGVPKRFDTYFFVTGVGRDAVATLHEEEAADMRWIAPHDALQTLDIIAPTRRNLEAVAQFRTANEAVDAQRGADIPTILPPEIDRRLRP